MDNDKYIDLIFFEVIIINYRTMDRCVHEFFCVMEGHYINTMEGGKSRNTLPDDRPGPTKHIPNILEGKEAVMKKQERSERKSTEFASVPSMIYKQVENTCDIRISHHYERSHVT